MGLINHAKHRDTLRVSFVSGPRGMWKDVNAKHFKRLKDTEITKFEPMFIS